ncbi:MAG: MFS transporter [Proteobacteria bacterium]|jgi:sugar phosphate permease|nr:MFS transporter [Pseudomonadota bacterium]
MPQFLSKGWLMSYFRLLRAEWRLLIFGLSFTCLSGFGQTFFISIFGAEIRDEFGLSHGGFGTLYSVGTFASAVSIIWLGKMIDHVDLRLYASLICLGMVAACFLMSAAATLFGLTLAIYMLRMTGQGLMGHTTMTSMARYLPDHRGKASGISATGHQLSEVLMPVPAVILITEFGWRQSWTGIGIFVLLAVLPWLLWLLRNHKERHDAYTIRLAAEEAAALAEDEAEAASPDAPKKRRVKHWTRKQVLSDWRFYLLLPAITAPALISTGIFFHQAVLVAEKGWSAAWFALTFSAFAVAGVVGSIVSGSLVDRFGFFKILPFYLMPMVLGMIALFSFTPPITALVFMLLHGLSNGGTVGVYGVLWPDLYGTKHLGAIRAGIMAIMVFITSLTPPAMGIMIDHGISVAAIAGGFAVYLVVAIALLVFAANNHRKTYMSAAPAAT